MPPIPPARANKTRTACVLYAPGRREPSARPHHVNLGMSPSATFGRLRNAAPSAGRVNAKVPDDDCTRFSSGSPCGRCFSYIRECYTDHPTGLYTISCFGCGQIRIKPVGGAKYGEARARTVCQLEVVS